MTLAPAQRLAAAGMILLVLWPHSGNTDAPPARNDQPPTQNERDRSPVDLAATPDGRFLLTANQGANSISMIDLHSGKVLQEVPCGDRPSAVAIDPAGKRVAVSDTFSGEVHLFALADKSLRSEGSLRLGYEPRGLVFSPDGERLYVALTTAHAVAVLDPNKRTVLDRIAVKRWPRYLALSPDGTRLAVGTSGDGGVSVVDTAQGKMLYAEEFMGLNLGQMQVSRDGKHVWFPWMVYRHNPITANNIRLGWVLASRIARVRLDGPARREALSLDPPGKAVSDPHGLALSPDETTLVCSASGTQELLVYRTKDLPLQDYGGTDHLPPALLKDPDRFRRISVGGRPMALLYTADGKRVLVANYLLNAVQEVDVAVGRILRTIDLGGAKEPSRVRRGEAIFFDGRRSLDQWYSCHSCHYEGHVNAVAMDTRNDGRFGNFKTVLSLRNVARTAPYFWHGWQKDLARGLERSLTESMLGPQPTPEDVAALQAYLETLRHPDPNPLPAAEAAAAARGEKVFRGDRAGCARCHSGETFTDGRIHDVGTGSRSDVYRGYNTPSLLGVASKVRFLHDGRASSLEEVLRGVHAPERVTEQGSLTEDQVRDLLAYLKSL